MRIKLESPARKVLVGLVVIVVLAYIGMAGREFLAAFFSERGDLISLQRAIRLDPHNARYRYLLGRYFWIIRQDANAAVPAFRAAAAWNPHDAHYWFNLAGTYEFLGDTEGQRDALLHAIEAEPTTPDVAWQAANFFVIRGDLEDALKEFRVVLANDPEVRPSLALCWRIAPDIDLLMRDVIPPMASVNSVFLDFLISKKEMVAASKVWATLAQLRQPVQNHYVFEYINALVTTGEINQARLVWQQAATLGNLGSYQPTQENLVVNGDFGLDLLNGGFDWIYHPSGQVSLALDPTQVHAGIRSLLMNFDTRGIEDAGIRQMIPVQPNTNYEFSAYFRSEDIVGAGAPRFAIQDLYSETMYFASEDLKDASFWKKVGGSFATGPQAKAVVLRIQRFPPGAIKGKLWIDGIRLVQRGPVQEAPKG